MSTRLDSVLQKHPDHADGIRLLAARDPSGNLKYLDWATKVLVSGQALAPEIADILDLFHRFNGRWFGRRRERIRPDIYTYRPQDLASLRDNLLKIKRATDSKRRKREKLYRIEGSVEAEVVYDSDDLIVRHIKNKQASVHYGHDTKWCIAMLREGYFDDYETNNAVFFFFERKAPLGNDLDKVALMVARNTDRDGDGAGAEAFTALDQRVDMMSLAAAYGLRVFDIFREIHERSARFPNSTMFQVYRGNATQAQLEAVFESVVKGGVSPHEAASVIQAICCNDAAPQTLLEEIRLRGLKLALAAWKRRPALRRHRRASMEIKDLDRAVMAAMSIHPNVSDDLRESLNKNLRRRRVDLSTIRRDTSGGRVAISYETSGKAFYRGTRRRYRRLRQPKYTVKQLQNLAERYDRRAVRFRKKARTLQKKLTEKKKRQTKRAKRVLARRAK